MPSDETFIGPIPGVEPTTLRRLNPGGRRPGGAEPARGGITGDEVRLWGSLHLEKLNPIIAAAAPLLNLAAQLKHRLVHGDVEALRVRVIQGIDGFERRVAPLGLSPRSVRASKYALCATLDDVVLNTPWGSRSVWTTRSMVGTFFSETWGGDRFFDLLAQLKKAPGINVDLLELLYYCISLGFEGKYRIAPRGASQLLLLREDLYRLIRAARGEFERDISPHWRGAQAAHRNLPALVPNWVVGVAAAAVLLLVYAALLFLLNGASDRAFAALANLPPTGAVNLARVAPPPPMPAAQSVRLRQALGPDLRAGQVTILEDAQTITLRLIGAGLFASGSADVQPAFAPLLTRIGAALNDLSGDVVIIGHTDNAPIHTLRFPSNYDLSLARARSVAALIEAQLRDKGRVTEEGRGDTQPVAPNTTTEGRQQNRRIDLLITKSNQG
jgi:type VI secretion system protein ImpK